MTRIHFGGILIFALVLGSNAFAAAPQVAFQLKDGWVYFHLTHDEQPVPEAQIHVYDLQGQLFAEGETGTDGKGIFPAPPGSAFRVTIRIDSRTADMINLANLDGELVPGRVLLSFGLAPCCRVPARAQWSSSRDEGPGGPAATSNFPGALPFWAQAIGGIVCTLLGIIILWVARRDMAETPGSSEAP